MTQVGVPREIAGGERRVALVPKVVERLTAMGLDVVIEADAGAAALIPDAAYEHAGAVVGDPWKCDVVVKVAPPSHDEIGRMRKGAALIGFLAPLTKPDGVRALTDAGITGYAMEAIPRISRAQSADALSSQANVAGYRAALQVAQHLTRFVPMLTTAAGTVPPAKVLVLGVGVAGLQALATMRRLGAHTTGYDVRPEVADQVRSVGAKWLDLGTGGGPEGRGGGKQIWATGDGGYARELTEAEKAEQQTLLAKAITGFDAVITTAQVPGRKAPTLVSAETVRAMRPGSVVVDLAGESGGNCESTVPGEVVVIDGVTIAAPLNLPASLPEHASELYARNVLALLELLVDKEGQLVSAFDDPVVAGACVTGSGLEEAS